MPLVRITNAGPEPVVVTRKECFEDGWGVRHHGKVETRRLAKDEWVVLEVGGDTRAGGYVLELEEEVALPSVAVLCSCTVVRQGDAIERTVDPQCPKHGQAAGRRPFADLSDRSTMASVYAKTVGACGDIEPDALVEGCPCGKVRQKGRPHGYRESSDTRET